MAVAGSAVSLELVSVGFPLPPPVGQGSAQCALSIGGGLLPLCWAVSRSRMRGLELKGGGNALLAVTGG